MIKILLKFEELQTVYKILIISFLIILIAFLDYFIANEISFSIFYLIPISLAAWTCSANIGIIFSTAGAALWILADFLSKNPYIYSGTILWDGFVRFGLFLIISLMLTTIKKQIELEEELIHYIVHDLKSPLVNILSGLRIIKEESENNEDISQDEIIDLSINSGEKLLLYISSILDLGRLEHRRMPIKITEINLDEIVEAAKKQIMGNLIEKDLTVMKIINFKKIESDEYLLLRIIINLLSNAVKVSPKGSEIIVKILQIQENELEFHVIDHGPGIKQEMQDLIFRKYNQADLMKKNRIQGSGLGLAFCKKAVEVLGGKIKAENNINGGADVIFTLPKQ